MSEPSRSPSDLDEKSQNDIHVLERNVRKGLKMKIADELRYFFCCKSIKIEGCVRFTYNPSSDFNGAYT